MFAVVAQVGGGTENGFQIAGRARSEVHTADIAQRTREGATDSFGLRFRWKQWVKRECGGADFLNGEKCCEPVRAVGPADGDGLTAESRGQALGFRGELG